MMSDLRLPQLYCESICQVPFEKLRQFGVTSLCIDLDNTLCLRHSDTPAPEIAEAIQRARETFGAEHLCILSNIVWGRHRAVRVAAVAKKLHISHYFAAHFWHRKPLPFPFLEAMRLMNSQPQQTAIIGDQMFTDIVGGNRLGLFTVLLNPLGSDHWTTRLTGRRRREAKILNNGSLQLYSGQELPSI